MRLPTIGETQQPNMHYHPKVLEYNNNVRKELYIPKKLNLDIHLKSINNKFCSKNN